MAQQVTTEATDNRRLLPMAEAAQAAVSGPGQVLHVVADAGDSNGEQAEACEAKGIRTCLPIVASTIKMVASCPQRVRLSAEYHIFGHPRFLLRGRRGAQAEISLAVIVYNLKRMKNVVGGLQLATALASA